MSLIANEALKSVLAIGVDGPGNEISWIGSGFIYARRLNSLTEAKTVNHLYVVSNKHVLCSTKQIVMRFASVESDEHIDIRQDLSPADEMRFYEHPDSEIDLAAFLINANVLKELNLDFGMISSVPHVATREIIKQEGISEGDGCFALGYPLGLVGANRHYPIVKSGCIARIKPFVLENSKEILIDAAIFPGNSGGPVLTRPENISVSGTKSPQQCYLLGIVSRYIPYRDVAVSRQTGHERIVFEDNSGIAIIVPAHYLYEWIDSLPQNKEEQIEYAKLLDSKSGN